MQLLFDCPWYFILLCLLAGALYSAALYWKGFFGAKKGKAITDKEGGQKNFPAKLRIFKSSDSRDNSDDMPRWARIAMPVLRFLSVSLIAFLLMAPLIKRHVATHEKPLIVVAVDNSESITREGENNPSLMAPGPTWSQLKKKYEVVFDTFGGKTTDIAAELDNISNRYAARNLGAVVLASDGIYNQGQHPANVAPRLAVPIYTIALGDTTHRPDAAVADIRYNQVVYLDNQFPIEVTLRASMLRGQQATLSVACEGRQLYSKSITFSDNDFSTTETIILSADKPGLKKYNISVSPCHGEVTTANNSRSIAIEVIDGHQKIAILANAPHPDITAIRQALATNPHYETDLFLAEELEQLTPQKLAAYSLVILHNLPSANHPKLQLSSTQPTLYIVGAATDLARFNALRSGLEIVAKAKKTDEVSAQHSNAFSLFSFDEEVCRTIEQLPPLSAPFGTYKPSGDLQSLFTARVGTLATDRPLIAFCQQEGVRHGFVVGEGLWRWRLHDYLITSSHRNFDMLMDKMVVYTSLQASHDRFRVTVPHILLDNEPVTLLGELYNDNFEPVNTPEALVTLSFRPDGDQVGPGANYGAAAVNSQFTTSQKREQKPSSLELCRAQETSTKLIHNSQKGTSTTYAFNRSGTGYTLPLGTLAPGRYHYAATTTFNGHKYDAAGDFIVQEASLEQATLVADHALLNTLSQTTGAQMLYPNQIDQLQKFLDQRDDLKTLIQSQTRYTSLLDLLPVFLLILLLLTAEWFLRKYFFKP